MNKTVNILGTEYKLEYKNLEDDKRLEGLGAYINFVTKNIVVSNLENDTSTDEEKALMQKRYLRHEVIHGYLYESGLNDESWGTNEEMIDFFAIQFEKIHKTYKNIGALENKERCIY